MLCASDRSRLIKLEDVAKHLGFAVVFVKDGVREVVAGAGQVPGRIRLRRLLRSTVARELANVCRRRTTPIMSRTSARSVVSSNDIPTVEPSGNSRRLSPKNRPLPSCISGRSIRSYANSVEERVRANFISESPKASRDKRFGQRVHALRNLLQPMRPVIHRVHPGHDRQQRLGGADVAGGFIAADVLLAGLDRHAIGGVALASLDRPINRPGILRAYSVLVARNPACGPAEAQGDAEPLGGADGDVGTEFTGGFDQRQCEKIGGERRPLRRRRGLF